MRPAHRHRLTLVLALLLGAGTSLPLRAQERFTLSGYVRDAATGEALMVANVFAAAVQRGTVSNRYGFYALTLPAGSYEITCSYVGYTPGRITFELTRDITHDFELQRQILQRETVVVAAERERERENIELPEMGRIRLDPRFTGAVPVLFGEQDLLKAIQLLPGVDAAREGDTGFSVRGGGIDGNLILLDEAPVFSPAHLLGFFSVFNNDAINDVTLMKGGAGAQYGGRLSSVVDVRMKEGNLKQWAATGGVGLIASRLTVEGPIARDRASFIVSGRRTYVDLFTRLSADEEIRETVLYFYDLNAKANWIVGDRDRLYLSGYFGRDVLNPERGIGMNWGNGTATLRWNHLFSNRLFANTSLVYSDYDYLFSVSAAGDTVDVTAGIIDRNMKSDFEYFLSPEHTLRFGFNHIRHTFIPGEIRITGESSFNEISLPRRQAHENALYAAHTWRPGLRLTLDAGVRFSWFDLRGPGTTYTYDDDRNVSDSRRWADGDLIRRYGGPEPRLTACYLIDERSSVKLSCGRNRQYLHLLSSTTATTPFDLWHPCSTRIRPGIADQVAAGFFRNFGDGIWETSVEVYYKDLRNQVDFRNGAWIMLNEHSEAELVFGRGWSYGFEVLVRKTRGRLSGWLGYTLSRTRRKIPAINGGRSYPSRYDHTHDLSLVGVYHLGERTLVSLNWVWATGDAVTFPGGRYVVDEHIASYYTERNSYRMPDYHRLDLACTWRLWKRGEREGNLNLSLYNAYGRRNAYAIDFRQNENDPTRLEAVRMALFTFVPSVSFSFRF